MGQARNALEFVSLWCFRWAVFLGRVNSRWYTLLIVKISWHWPQSHQDHSGKCTQEMTDWSSEHACHWPGLVNLASAFAQSGCVTKVFMKLTCHTRSQSKGMGIPPAQAPTQVPRAGHMRTISKSFLGLSNISIHDLYISVRNLGHPIRETRTQLELWKDSNPGALFSTLVPAHYQGRGEHGENGDQRG